MTFESLSPKDTILAARKFFDARELGSASAAIHRTRNLPSIQELASCEFTLHTWVATVPVTHSTMNDAAAVDPVFADLAIDRRHVFACIHECACVCMHVCICPRTILQKKTRRCMSTLWYRFVATLACGQQGKSKSAHWLKEQVPHRPIHKIQFDP